MSENTQLCGEPDMRDGVAALREIIRQRDSEWRTELARVRQVWAEENRCLGLLRAVELCDKVHLALPPRGADWDEACRTIRLAIERELNEHAGGAKETNDGA